MDDTLPPGRAPMHRRPNPDEATAQRVALDALVATLGLRPGDEERAPERGALARLAERVGVSEQRIRAAYSGAVAVRPATLARWAERLHGTGDAPPLDAATLAFDNGEEGDNGDE